MKIYEITVELIEQKHYWDCQDVISHPLVCEAFMFGDQNGKGYDTIQWNNELMAAEIVVYDNGKYEVFVGEWLGTIDELYAQAGEY